MGYLIKNGTVVYANGSYTADVLVEGEKITQVAKTIDAPGMTVIDASGKYIFPGFIDTHTHFDLDAGDFHTADDFYTGTKAAIAGGTTSILDFTTQEKGQTLTEALDVWHKMADGKSSCDYGFHMSITDWNDESKKEIKEMTRQGVTSYKLYMAYDNLKVNDKELFEILSAIEEEHGIAGVHCENGDIIKAVTEKLKSEERNSVRLHPKSRPAEAEAEAINRLLTIAKLAGTPVNIVHLSSKQGLKVVQRARKEGQQVFVETCPQYLILDEKEYNRPGFAGAAYVCAPPLRKKKTGRHSGRQLKRTKLICLALTTAVSTWMVRKQEARMILPEFREVFRELNSDRCCFISMEWWKEELPLSACASFWRSVRQNFLACIRKKEPFFRAAMQIW